MGQMNIKCLMFGLLFTLLLTTAGGVHAASITYSTGYGSGAYGSLVQPDWSITLSLPKFDASLGTLTSITVTNTGEIFGQIELENKKTGAFGARSITATLGSTMEVTLPNGFVLSSNPTNSQTQAFTAYDGATDYANGSGNTWGSLTGLNTTFTTVNPLDMLMYIGTGTLDYSVFTYDSSFVSVSGNYAVIFTDAAGLLLDVTYTYDPVAAPVPEPGMIALIGSGMLLFGMRALSRGRTPC